MEVQELRHPNRSIGTFRAQPRTNSTFLLTSLMMEPTSLMESTNLMMEPIVERLRTFKTLIDVIPFVGM
jgi:hypothetical protein